MKNFTLLIRLFLAAVCALAAVSKLSDQDEFRLFLEAHTFIPATLVSLLVAVVPAFELSLAVSIIHSPHWRAIRWLLLGSMTFFLIYQLAFHFGGAKWGFPPEGGCKCMKLPEVGLLEEITPLARNIGLLCLAGVYFWFTRPSVASVVPSDEAAT